MIKRFLTLFFFSLLLPPGACGADHGVVLLYHHVSDSTPPSTSVAPDRFRQHLDYLADNGFEVMPLDELLSRALAGDPLPDNAVAITFDDAYLSVFAEAAPRLKSRDWPFTVFLASEPLDEGVSGYMTWQQARQLLAMGGDIQAHSHSHDHLATRRKGESGGEWRQRIAGEIDGNLRRLEAELGVDVTAFAYPFGEYNPELKRMLEARNLHGLAQQSGAVGAGTDPLQIPRFPLSTGYADLERFKVAVNSRPLPVMNEKRDGKWLALELAAAGLPALGCYSAGGDRLQLEREGDRAWRIRLPATGPGRNKVNCTAPTGDRQGEFYWYSYLWMGGRD